MFKKLKEEISEKVKQSPLKFQASVQQLTQTVSPSSVSANNSVGEITVAEDEEEDAEEKYDPMNDRSSASELDNSFTTVDLRSPSTPITRRLSSSSSITSDLFPIYEVPPSRYLQSDLESCSEFDDGSSIHQFNSVTKENLYEKYRNTLQKYHKYRGRFIDVQKYCQELQRELNKAKNVLTETQDKAIRRIAELKEQCSLEQKAKAHLEDALRNELEERDHIINTLNTKIELLKSGKDCDDISHSNVNSKTASKIISTCDRSVNESGSTSEVENLKEKVKHFEALLIKSKDAITSKNSQIQELYAKVECAKKEVKTSNDRNVDLQNKIDVIRRKEEESLLSLAENKLNVHQELEAKESQIKSLENKIAEFEKEMKKLRNAKSVSDAETPDEPVDVGSKDDDELKALKDELHQLKITRNDDLTSLAEKDRLLHEFKTAVDLSNHELSKLRNEVKASSFLTDGMKVADVHADLKQRENAVKELEAALSEKQNELKVFATQKEAEIGKLNETKTHFENRVAELEQKLSVAKTEAIEKSSLADSLKDQVGSLNGAVQQSKVLLDEKETQLNQQNDLVSRLRADLAALNVEVKDNATDKKVRLETETHLKADKIVLEETLKTLRSELNVCQTELRAAKNSVAECEKAIAEKEDAAALKTEIEKRLIETEAELSQSIAELEHTKRTEHEMLLKTTSLLEEINNLKSKEDQYLNQVRKLKTDVTDSRDEAAILQEKFKQRCDEYECTQKESEELKTRCERLQAQVNETQRLNETLSGEQTNLRQQMETLRRSSDAEATLKQRDQEYERLKTEHETLKAELEAFRVHSAAVQLAGDAARDERAQLEERMKELQRSRDESENLLKRIENMEAERCQWERGAVELADFKRQAAKLLEENDLLRRDCQMWEVKKNDLEKSAQRQEQTASSLEHQLEERAAESQQAREQNERLRCEYEELRTRSQTLHCDNQLYARGYDEMNSFLRDVKPILEQCTHYKHLLADVRHTNRNLISENEEYSRNVTSLQTKVTRWAEECKKLNDEVSRLNVALENSNRLLEERKPADPTALVAVRKQTSNLKTEYLRFKTDLVRELNVLKQYCVDCGNHVSNGGIKTIQSHLKTVSNLEDRLSSLEQQCESLQRVKSRLEDEKTQLQMRVDELLRRERRDAEDVDDKEKIKLVEETYSSKIKQMMADFETQLAQKDTEYEELQNKLFLRDDKEKAAVAQETKEIVRNFHEELTCNQDAYEQLLEKYRQDTELLKSEKSELREQHAKALRESDKKWRLCLDKKIMEMEEKHKDEINELTKEWSADRKQVGSVPPVKNIVENQILEDFAKHSEDNEALKQQIHILTNELNSCKKSQWKDIDLELINAYGNTNHSQISIEDCTEMEYLRNILFEYMMGHQPMVLAKVLAAVVKFDNNQTKQILQREEQKLSLLGQLGLT